MRDLDLRGLPSPRGHATQHGATEPVDVVVGDLSFISLRMVLEPLVRATRPGGHLVLLVKPQFEVGRDRLGRGGVVASAQRRADAVVAVAQAMVAAGAVVRAVVPSSITGESGNQEYFLWGRVGAGEPARCDVRDARTEAEADADADARPRDADAGPVHSATGELDPAPSTDVGPSDPRTVGLDRGWWQGAGTSATRSEGLDPGV